MYADPRHIRKHRINLSLSDPERRLVEAVCEINGEQVSTYLRRLVLGAILEAGHASNDGPTGAQLRASH